MIIKKLIDYGEILSTLKTLINEGKGEVGAVVSYVGVVKNDKVKAFEVLLKQEDIRKVLTKAYEEFSIIDAYVLYREGLLKPGEIIICVLVAARDRVNGFLACKFIIDNIKKVMKKREFTK